MKYDLDMLFPQKKQRIRHPKEVSYDVKITSNKNGKSTTNNVRFAFFNKAKEIATVYEESYCELSDIHYLRNRIYFRFYDGKEKGRKMWKVSHKGGTFMSFSPDVKTEKMYRMNWIGEYTLKYDAEIELYYIENIKED